MRQSVMEAMDIVGGAGICKGQANFMSQAYLGIPIAITVEGANALTRSLISFGQGLNRSHPHLLDLIETIRAGNDLPGFNRHASSRPAKRVLLYKVCQQVQWANGASLVSLPPPSPRSFPRTSFVLGPSSTSPHILPG